MEGLPDNSPDRHLVYLEANIMVDLRPTSYPGVMLRSTTSENDNEQLYRVFAASRTDLMFAIEDWDEEQKDVFVRFQFKAEQDQYRSNYPDACFDMIVRGNEVIGYIYTAKVGDEIRLVAVTLTPEYRNRGIGHALIQDLLDEGERLQKYVTLHVQQGNPAHRLYVRLGFIEAGEQGIYRRMEWRPSSSAA